ncbi:hypothetical protein BD769DRAFT_698968 [Suillus cothurnatus]|nr:hypothetical protein BD769DRAFT_698968 [Suillus cothurnatus]
MLTIFVTVAVTVTVSSKEHWMNRTETSWQVPVTSPNTLVLLVSFFRHLMISARSSSATRLQRSHEPRQRNTWSMTDASGFE